MDKKGAINLANIYARLLKNQFGDIRVFLFGSYAKGNYNKDSDIDIAVVFDDYINLLDIQLELMRIRRGIDSRIEPHPFRKQDFDVTHPLAYEILSYGLEIK